LATQRITVAKIVGVAADIALKRLREWSAARQPNDPNGWSAGQWPQDLRKRADDFADQLRAHAWTPPIVHFVEWVDLWSMGDLFGQWLTPPDGPNPCIVYTNRYEIFAYSLPDGGRLAQHLAAAGPQQCPETAWFIMRLREGIAAWEKLLEQAVVVVLRSIVGATVLDQEVMASLRRAPEWLS
jgi:hypothetical protein